MAESTPSLPEFLSRLASLYLKSREAIALLENYDEKKEAHLAPHNELRNALDHIMRMILGQDDSDLRQKEFRGAEAHMLRAGYDSYELICIGCFLYINEKLKKYSSSDISSVFPEYYTQTKKQLLDLQKQTAKLREAKKQDNFDGEDTFPFYFEAVDSLLEIRKQVDERIPALDAYYSERINKEKKEDKRYKRSVLFGVIGIIGTIVTIASLILMFLLK